MARLSVLQGTHEGLQGLRSGRLRNTRLGVIAADLNPYGDIDSAFGIDPDETKANPWGGIIYFRGDPFGFGYAWEAGANYSPSGTNINERALSVYNISPGKAVGKARDGKYYIVDATKGTPEYDLITKQQYDSYIATLVGKIKRQEMRVANNSTQVSPLVWLGLAIVGYKLFVK